MNLSFIRLSRRGGEEKPTRPGKYTTRERILLKKRNVANNCLIILFILILVFFFLDPSPPAFQTTKSGVGFAVHVFYIIIIVKSWQ